MSGGGWFRNVLNGIVHAAEDLSSTFGAEDDVLHGNHGRPTGGGRRRGGGRSYPGQRRGTPAAAPAPAAQPQRVPPASQKAVRQLPTIKVTPEDLVDPSNRECCICLEE